MRVLSIPTPAEMEGDESGIVRVVQAYHRYLPAKGVEFVSRKEDPYDISVGHAGSAVGPDVVHNHGLYWTADYAAGSWEWAVNKNVVEACRRAKIVTVPSNWVAETFRRDMRISPVVLPHGIEWDEFQNPPDTKAYVLWNKNRTGDVCDPAPVGLLAEAFDDMDFVTTFAPKRAPSNVKEIGLVPHGAMKTWVNNCLTYLATTKETFGIGILEAMASGVPTLGFDHGGVKDLIVHGETGYLARVNDFNDLKEGLQYCIKNRKVLGKNAREAARQYTWEVTIDKVYAVYERALEKPEPTVSIIIPHFNYAGKVGKAIESAMRQTYDLVREIIVVDDGSDDPAQIKKVVAGFRKQDKRVRLIQQENGGVAIARNTGIASADSKYVCCLDADDWIDPTFIAKLIAPLEEDRSIGITYSSLHWHKPDGTDGISKWPGEWDFDRQLIRQNQVPTCCLFRKEMWERLGGFRARYAPHGAGSEDADFWTRSGAYGYQAVKATNEALFHYSWMSGHVTGDPDYREVDWLAWHPWTRDDKHPFASYAKPDHISHPVRQYDVPLISVVIPVGPTHEKYLVDALDSLEAQTFRNWQAIVVWDRTDGIPDYYLNAYPYVKWLWLGDNLGTGEARNEGVAFADAPFLLFLDADDWLYPEAMSVMLDAWNEDDAIVYTDFVGKSVVDNPKMLADDLQERLYSWDKKTGDAIIGYRSANYNCTEAQKQPAEKGYPFIWSLVTALIPKVWHDEIGGFDEDMHSWEDADYHWRMARAGKCYVRIPEELLVVRFKTGTRRDLGLQDHKALIKYLNDKYKEIPAVGCNCGNNKTSRVRSKAMPVRSGSSIPAIASRTVQQEAHMSDQDFVLVKYIHPNKGRHKVIGIGTRTNYGRRMGGEEFLVHKADVARQSHLFIELDARRPPQPDRVTRAPMAIDPEKVTPSKSEEVERPANAQGIQELQLLPGVTQVIEKDMNALGLHTFADVKKAGRANLVKVRGIGEVKADAILAFVNKMLANQA